MINGFLNVNKPKNITSYGVIRILRKFFYGQKLGHLGTLDPLASGVLVIALNEATKLIEFINNCDKEYDAEVTLGAQSSTYDLEGKLKSVSDRKPLLKEIKSALKCFKGEINQVPPIYSAVKIKGKKAYEIARKGMTVDISPRKINISGIKIISYAYPVLKIKVECSSGTYIRSLANDIGDKLKTGAYLSNLLRTRVGNFNIKNAVEFKLESKMDVDYFKRHIIPLEKIAKMFPKMLLNSIEYKKLNFGQTILKPKAKEGIDLFAGFYKNSFVGILERAGSSMNKVFKYYKKLNID